MPDDVSGSPAGDQEPASETLEREFREALRRLAVGAEDFDLSLAGYSRVMREIDIVRRQSSALRSGAKRSARMAGMKGPA